MAGDKVVGACPECGKEIGGDCGRAVCPRRKIVTAQIADGCCPVVNASGTYRRPPTKQGSES